LFRQLSKLKIPSPANVSQGFRWWTIRGVLALLNIPVM
jgi:hypothetical protein